MALSRDELVCVAATVLVLGAALVLGGLHAASGGEVRVTPTLLVTGFGPFGIHESNPAWGAIEDLDGQEVGGLRLRTGRLDVVYDRAREQLDALVAEHDPDLVLCLGVAPGDDIRLEAVARNLDDRPDPDNEGTVREGEVIRPGGPTLLPSGLPLARLHATLEAEGYEVFVSDDAGGYLCNHVFYGLMDGAGRDHPAGFVHVPVVGARWDLARIRDAVRRIIEVLGEGR